MGYKQLARAISGSRYTEIADGCESVLDELLRRISSEHDDDRIVTVIRLRFGLDGRSYTRKEIGAFYGVSDAQVRLIENKGFRILRRPWFHNKLRPYVINRRGH